jgi:hypothetical protein
MSGNNEIPIKNFEQKLIAENIARLESLQEIRNLACGICKTESRCCENDRDIVGTGSVNWDEILRGYPRSDITDG